MNRRARLSIAGPKSPSPDQVVCTGCGELFRFMLHHDSKTAPLVKITDKGGGVALVPNAFPLPVGPLEMGGLCDAVTAACVDCYAANLESLYGAFARGAAVNLANLEHLKACGGQRAVVAALVSFVRRSEYLQRAHGVTAPSFRWHSGGDVFATWYGRAIRAAVIETPGVDHWIYTRDTGKVASLLPAPENLCVYLSADSENYGKVARAAARHGLPIALLADDAPAAVALWARILAAAPGVSQAVTCPASDKYVRDAYRIAPHVTGLDRRRSSAVPGGLGMGACIACRVCLPGGLDRSVTFLLHGGKAAPGAPGRLGAAIRRRSIPLAVGS